jgi:hypothetical protein
MVERNDLFTVGGISLRKGEVKVRFCSDMVLRYKNLHRQGDENIQLIELPMPMTKAEICRYLIEKEQFAQYKKAIIIRLNKYIECEAPTART